MFIKIEELEVPESRAALCRRMQEDVRYAKKHFKDDFAKMIEDMDQARKGAAKNWNCKSQYVVNITQRFVRQKTASLYAKNPRAVAKRRPRMTYMIWDGDQASLETAHAQIALASQEEANPPQTALALVQDVANGRKRERLLDRVGKTLELMFRYYTDEQKPNFKGQMKRCVRSAVTTGVGYVRLGFQRDMDLDAQTQTKIADDAAKLAHIERLQTDLEDRDTQLDPETAAEAEELRLAIERAQKSEKVLIREGLVFDFPRATSIIPDPETETLQGWVGASWVAEEVFLTPDEIKEFYNVDIGAEGNYQKYSTSGAEYRRNPRKDLSGKKSDMACVWILYHKPTGLKYTLCDGCTDYLEDPEAPDVDLERFFPIYALVYNELEHPRDLFPPSDVSLMRDGQMEMNRSRQSLREHRKASRPGYVSPRGALQENDKTALANHEENALVEIDGMVPGQKIEDLLMGIPKQGIDPNLYDNSQVMQDIYLSTGGNESSYGGTSGATATESSIAEASRTSSLEAEIDELNDFLTELAADAGQVMLAELSLETVKSLVGPGAAWPEMSREDIQKEVYLSVVAGSNGRPNRAMRQQALSQLTPFLLQMPGVNPEWLVKLMVEAVDDTIDITEAIADGIPSITAMNNMDQVDQGENPQSAQGGQGGNNATAPARPTQGPGPQGGRATSAQA